MTSHLFVGQLPVQPLRIAVTGATLLDYDVVEVHMRNPLGDAVDLSAGTVLLDEAADGVVKYAWGPASPFAVVGDYAVQVRLLTDTATEYTTTAKIEVYRPEAAP